MRNNGDSKPTLTNVTISGNHAEGDGGAISNSNSHPILKNVTISANSAGQHGYANDLDGKARISGARIDLGAYENEEGS